jgi:predicted DCC family thiol-disulfide oxidoreductase YuxK
MNDPPIKLLYDGQCPFCRREVAWLKRRDHEGRIATEDITDPSFHAERYGLTQEEVMGVLHGILPDGRVVRRVDAIREAYQAVGLGWIVAPLSWPVLGWMAEVAYGLFARNRLALGRLFGRKCEGTCSLGGKPHPEDRPAASQ